MFYKNIPTSTKKINYQLIDLLSSDNLNFDNCEKNSKAPKLCVNLKNANNKLTASYGDERFNCHVSPDSEICVYPEIANLNNIIYIKFFVGSKSKLNNPKKQLLALTSDYKLYVAYLDDSSTGYLELIDLTEYCDYRFLDYSYQNTNYLIISTKYLDESLNYIYRGHGDFPVQFAKDFFIYDICNHNNTMFLVLDEDYRNKILFSDDVNPLNLGDNISSFESIDIPSSKGKILKLISYDDYLYVVCEFGIIRVVSYSSQKEHCVEEIYSGSAKIIGESIVLGGDNIIFADELGIYIFNGNSVEKVQLNFDSLLNGVRKHKSVACFNDNKYYLATKVNYSDGIVDNYNYHKNNCLIIYDTISKKTELCIDISIKQLICYQDAYTSRIAILSATTGVEQLYTLSNSSGLYDYDNVSKKIFLSSAYNMNKSAQKKLMRFLFINTIEDVKVIIHTNYKKIEHNIKGSAEEQKIALNIRTNDFSVELISETEKVNITSLKILVGVYE